MTTQPASHVVAAVVLLDVHSTLRALCRVRLQVLLRSRLVPLLCALLILQTSLVCFTGLFLVHQDFADRAVAAPAQLATEDIAVVTGGMDVAVATICGRTSAEQRILLDAVQAGLLDVACGGSVENEIS